MRKPAFTSRFKRDYKLQRRRGKKMLVLEMIMARLIMGLPLPLRHRDHILAGDYADFRECHIEPDWLLIYRIQDKEITFIRTGTHADLFG